MKWLKIIGLALAFAFVALTVFNASWLAPTPGRSVKLVAHRGIHQNYDHAGVGRDDCTATRIEQPVHGFLENTAASIKEAGQLGAVMIEVDVAPTRDGEMVVFHDWTVDCRTDSTGNIRDLTLAELQALDIGHGYTPDDGRTYPFRGKFTGAMPTVAQAVEAAKGRQLIFNFKSDDPAEADMLLAALDDAGRSVKYSKDAFYGPPGPVQRIRELHPTAWAFTPQEAEQCTRDYALSGWFGIVPDTCRGGTIFIPLDYQWALPGWPNRMIARMEEADVEMILLGPVGPKDGPRGIDLPEQLGDIPDSYNGHVWVEDIYAVGPALRPAFNRRNPDQEEALAAALERRRAARE